MCSPGQETHVWGMNVLSPCTKWCLGLLLCQHMKYTVNQFVLLIFRFLSNMFCASKCGSLSGKFITLAQVVIGFFCVTHSVMSISSLVEVHKREVCGCAGARVLSRCAETERNTSRTLQQRVSMVPKLSDSKVRRETLKTCPSGGLTSYAQILEGRLVCQMKTNLALKGCFPLGIKYSRPGTKM